MGRLVLCLVILAACLQGPGVVATQAPAPPTYASIPSCPPLPCNGGGPPAEPTHAQPAPHSAVSSQYPNQLNSPPPSVTCSITIIGSKASLKADSLRTRAEESEDAAAPKPNFPPILDYYYDGGPPALMSSLSPPSAGVSVVGWAPERITINCSVSGGDPNAPVYVTVGGGLAPFLSTGGPNVHIVGNLVFGASREDQKGFSLTFRGPWHRFTLADSALIRVPLSYDPLISCISCGDVEVVNTQLEHLYGSPEVLLECDTTSCTTETLVNRTVGALYFFGPRSLAVDGLTCSDVQNANDFACLMLELGKFGGCTGPGEGPVEVEFVSIARSTFASNTVKPGSCLVTSSLKDGLGAVALHVPYGIAVNLGHVELNEVTMTDNLGGVGPGLAIELDDTELQLGSLEISGSAFRFNTARKHGGAIYVGNLGSAVGLVHFTNSTLSSNTAGIGNDGNGGAFYCNSPVEMFLIDGDSNFVLNKADLSGGALWLERGVRNLSVRESSRISWNNATRENGGGIYIESNDSRGPNTYFRDADSITVSGNSFISFNFALRNGGAFFINQNVRQVVVSHGGSVAYNRAALERGGGIYVGRTLSQPPELRLNVGTLMISNGSYIYHNHARVRGGGVYIDGNVNQGGVIVVDGGHIDSNRVISKPAEFGAGIGICGFLSSLTVADMSSISDNTITGARFACGGGVWANDYIGSITVTNGSSISRNKASMGGAAVAVVPVEGPGHEEHPQANYTVITRSVLVSGGSCICDNSCGYDADNPSFPGALYFEVTRILSFVVTDHSSISGNTVTHGDGNGGAVYAEHGIAYFSLCNGSRMNSNRGGRGGALHFPLPGLKDEDGAYLMSVERFEMCGGAQMVGNEARILGGAIYISGLVGEIVISNSTIAGNVALISAGGIYLDSVPQRVLISDSVVDNNRNTKDHGGFMHVTVQAYDDSRLWPAAFPPGPYNFDIVRSNFTKNYAFKNGGGIAFVLFCYVPTLDDRPLREKLLRERYVNLRITESNFTGNTANWGAGGAIYYLTLMPMPQKQERAASVYLGSHIEITKSTFRQNRCGDDTQRLSFVEDVSPLQGMGGAVFVWAMSYGLTDDTPEINRTTMTPPSESAACTQEEVDLPPGLAAFGNMSCWPTGTRACAVLMDDVTMADNAAHGGYGGGFTSAGCGVKVARSRFSNNTAAQQGGGLAFMDFGTYWYVTLANFSSVVRSPDTPTPPPVRLWPGQAYEPPHPVLRPPAEDPFIFRNVDNSRPLQQPWLVMYDTVVEGNSARDGAGALIEVNRTSAVVVNCSFSGNKAPGRAGGVLLVANSTLARITTVFRDTNFTENVAGSDGGAVCVQLTYNKAVAVMVGGTINGNIATQGAGIYANAVAGTSLLLWGLDIHNNSAYGAGGGIYYEFNPYASGSPSWKLPIFEATLHLSSCKLHENVALIVGGGAFLATSQNTSVKAEHSSFTSNTAVDGAGLYLDASQGGESEVSNCSLSGNKAAQHGGGAYIAATCGGRLVLDAGSILSGNSAGKLGGAVVVVNAGSVTVGNVDQRLASGNPAGTITSNSSRGGSGGGGSSGGGSATCNSSGLVLSNAVLTGNSAQQGGAVYASVDTVVFVNASALTNNTASVSGGAIAAVNASLLHVSGCDIVDNLALLSGGGAFCDRCLVFLMEDGSLTLNSASTGGGVHVAGSPVATSSSPAAPSSPAYSYNNTSNNTTAATRRRLLEATTIMNSGGSRDSTPGAAATPVAVFINVKLHGNVAASGLYRPDSDQATTVTYTLTPEQVQTYEGHGGGMFISDVVGVAVSRSDAAQLGNTADIGTVLATTQVCSELATQQEGPGPISPLVARLLGITASGRWTVVASALSWAAGQRCSLLVLRNTRLPWSTASTPTLNSTRTYTAAKMTASRWQQVQSLPLLWLQDLTASSLQARCSPTTSDALLDPPSEEASILQIIHQHLATRQQQQGSNSVPFPPSAPQPPPLAPTNLTDAVPASNSLSSLLGMVQSCTEAHRAAEQPQENTLTVAVPATHLRVMNISGALLLPSPQDGNRGPKYLNSTGGRAFGQEDILALVIAPNVAFDLKVQLFDGLGQPVVTDTPTFEVSIEIRPATTASSSSMFLALLRSSDSVTVNDLTTSKGVVTWKALELLGWPGQYFLDIQARGSSVNTTLPKIKPLTITVELLPCEMGQELDKSKDRDHVYWTGCTSCRRDQVGLWADRRQRLLQPLPDVPGMDLVSNMTAEIKLLTSSDGSDTCAACCLTCPAHAACPGGSLLVPTAGYWHSSPSSPLLHRCPQPGACGITVGGSSGLDGVWAHMLKVAFNISDAYVVINTTSTPSIIGSSGVIGLGKDDFLLASLRRDVRSLLLGTCQLWWYSTFPPNQEAVLVTGYNVTLQVNMSAAPCFLNEQAAAAASASGDDDALDRWYMQLQCATGYTGHICATCEPGYSLTVDFSCMECPPLARTVAIGLLAFWGTVALILFTAFSNLSKNRQEAMQMEELSALDLLKTLITHIQYFVIITKLGIDYPAIITKFQSVLSAVIGTENYIAYSPSCLFEGLNSAGQAALQIGFGLGAPCMATLVTLLLWILRYYVANQSVLRRAPAQRWTPNMLSDLPEVLSVEKDEAKQAGAGGGGYNAPNGLVSELGRAPAAAAPAASAPAAVVVTHSVGLPSCSSVFAPPSSSRLDLSSSLPPPISTATSTSPYEIAVQHVNTSCSTVTRDPIPPATPFATSAAVAAAAAAFTSPPKLAVLGATPSIMNASHIPQICIKLDDEPDTPSNSKTLAAMLAGQLAKSPQTPKTTSAVGWLSAGISKLRPAAAIVQPATPLPMLSMLPAMPATPPPNVSVSAATAATAAATATAGAPPPLPSQQSLMRAGPNPFATNAPPEDPAGLQPVDSGGFFDPIDDRHLPSGHKAEDEGDWKTTLKNVFANPGQWLMFADQAVPLLQQLEVVVIVASFILYPSLCQVSLSIFACYKLDSGDGIFAENQAATWSEGYWVRNMQQECYTGLHRRVYVPIGITSVLLFCLVPPVVYFLLTFMSRRQFDDPRVRIQYGFLYLQYKPKYFWWASMRQLQVLALVAVEVFGRALPVLQQALLLLAVLILIAGVNTVNAPERFTVLMLLEFLSMCVLSMTLTLGLYFVTTDTDSQLDTTSANIVGSIILVINAVFILAVLVFMAKRSAEVAKKMRRVLSTSWHSMVTSLSRALSRVEFRYSERSGTRRNSRLSLKLSGPKISGPNMSGPNMSGPRMSGATMSVPKQSGQ